MQAFRTSNRTTVSSLQYGLKAGSFDCSEEFSLGHWIRVCRLVSESETPEVSGETVYCAGANLNLNSEMESTTADEHFARDVV